MNNYAPVLITVYDRFNHLKNAVESLKKCAEAVNTEIFIASDMTSEKEKEFQIFEIRNYINSIQGFKKVTPIFFDENAGIEHSWHFSLDLVFQKYDKIIFLEDDIEVSPFFLNYINEGLDFYKDDPKVFSICGFSPYALINDKIEYVDQYFYSNRWNPWGFGIWKNSYYYFLKFYENHAFFSILSKDLEDKNFKQELDGIGKDLYPHLLYCLKKKRLPAFDHSVSYYCLKNEYKSLYPYKSFTINNGLDGSGQHSGKNNNLLKIQKNHFSTYLIDRKYEFWDIKLNNKPFYNRQNKLINKFKTLTVRLGVFDIAKKTKRLIK